MFGYPECNGYWFSVNNSIFIDGLNSQSSTTNEKKENDDEAYNEKLYISTIQHPPVFLIKRQDISPCSQGNCRVTTISF